MYVYKTFSIYYEFEVVNTGWLVSVCSPELSFFGGGSILELQNIMMWVISFESLCMLWKNYIFE